MTDSDFITLARRCRLGVFNAQEGSTMTNVVKLSRAKERSAVSEVQMSGLDLVARRKPKGKSATLRDFAKIDWTPLERTETPGPSAECMSHLGFYSRAAGALMQMTKTDLIEMHTKLEHEAIDALMAGLLDTTERMKALAKIADCAYLRVLASAAAHNLAGGKFKGVHDMRRKKRTRRSA